MGSRKQVSYDEECTTTQLAQHMRATTTNRPRFERVTVGEGHRVGGFAIEQITEKWTVLTVKTGIEYQVGMQAVLGLTTMEPRVLDRYGRAVQGTSLNLGREHVYRRSADNIFASALIWPFCTFRGDEALPCDSSEPASPEPAA